MTNEITIRKAEVAKVSKIAESITIKDNTSMEKAVNEVSSLKLWENRITKEKEKVTVPLNAALKAERARWKPMEILLEDAIKLLRSKISVYQGEQVKKRAEIEANIAEQIGNGIDVERGLALLAEAEEAPDQIKTANGVMRFRTVKKYEVFDMKKLPLKYHLPNDILLREITQNGVEVEGVKYWEEQQPINYV